MIYIGADHRGLELKGHIERWMQGREMEFEDLGVYEYDRNDDYVDVAIMVAQKVADNPEKNWGIVICGSGVGVSIAANKVAKIRCGLGFSPDQVYAARKEDNINVLALPADNMDENTVMDLVEKFFETEFVRTERYLRREEKIARYENEIFNNQRH